jgi:hypothetical protein
MSSPIVINMLLCGYEHTQLEPRRGLLSSLLRRQQLTGSGTVHAVDADVIGRYGLCGTRIAHLDRRQAWEPSHPGACSICRDRLALEFEPRY